MFGSAELFPADVDEEQPRRRPCREARVPHGDEPAAEAVDRDPPEPCKAVSPDAPDDLPETCPRLHLPFYAVIALKNAGNFSVLYYNIG